MALWRLHDAACIFEQPDRREPDRGPEEIDEAGDEQSDPRAGGSSGAVGHDGGSAAGRRPRIPDLHVPDGSIAAVPDFIGDRRQTGREKYRGTWPESVRWTGRGRISKLSDTPEGATSTEKGACTWGKRRTIIREPAPTRKGDDE